MQSKRFSATELARAHLDAIEKAGRSTPTCSRRRSGRSPWRGRRTSKIARGEARPLEGLPLGIKDLFCTEGVVSTAGSNILRGFEPPYESTVTHKLWRDGAVMLGKLNMDEFAMGSSNETSAFGPVVSPWRRKGSNVHAAAERRRRSKAPIWCRAAPRAARPRRWRRGSASGPRRPTPAAPSASPPPSPARSGSSRPTGAARAGASSPSPPPSTRRARSPARCGTPRSCCAPWRAPTRRTRPAPTCRCRTSRPRRVAGVKGLRDRHPEGIPPRRHAGTRSSALWQTGRRMAAGGRRRDRRGLAAAHEVRAAGLLHRRPGRGLLEPRPLRRRALRPARAGPRRRPSSTRRPAPPGSAARSSAGS